jgi:hypothetical protein
LWSQKRGVDDVLGSVFFLHISVLPGSLQKNQFLNAFFHKAVLCSVDRVNSSRDVVVVVWVHIGFPARTGQHTPARHPCAVRSARVPSNSVYGGAYINSKLYVDTTGKCRHPELRSEMHLYSKAGRILGTVAFARLFAPKSEIPAESRTSLQPGHLT